MAFPQTPLPISVELSYDSGVTWTDVTSDVRAEDGIQIDRGRSDWGQQVDAGRCTFSLSDTDGTYSPRNPESTLYGEIGRNTPVRVSVNTGDVALWLPSNSNDGTDTCNAADVSALGITGDIDVRFDATLFNWYLADVDQGQGGTSVLTELIGKYRTSDAQRSWVLYAQYGYLKFTWSEDGTVSNGFIVSSTAKLPVPASGRLAVRVTLDVDNGSSGWTAKFYTAETIDSAWVQLGDTIDFNSSGTTSIFDSTASLSIGNAVTGTAYTAPGGYVHAAKVLDGIDGTAVADVDFSAQTVGDTAFTDSAGLDWTVSNNAELTDRKVRFVGEVASWTPTWDTGGFDVVTEVEATGVMRRMGQGAVPAKSPMFREFTSPFRTNIVAYWPMEDASGAASLASAFDGHPAVSITGDVTPANYDDWTASDPLVTVDTGSMQVVVPSYTATDYIFIRLFVAVPEAGVASTQRLISFSQTGTARTWSVYLNTSGGLDLRAYDAGGVSILTTGFGSFAVNGKKKSLGIELTQSGSDINYKLFSYDIDSSTLTSSSVIQTTGTLSSYTVGRVTTVRFGQDGLMNETAFGHLAIADLNTAFASTAGALIGWDGETTSQRIHRLGLEEDIRSFSTAASEEQLGVQARATVLDLMRTAGDVDEGILAEQRDILGIRLVQLGSLYNQVPGLVLDYTGSDGLVAPLDPVDDDQSVTNDVTVAREGGSSARVVDTVSALSTQAPPSGIGLYDTSYTLNLFEDEQTITHAGWRLLLGTWDETRFPQVTVNLAGAPGSIPDAAACDTGSRIQITNPPVWLPPDTIDLMVQGYTERLDQYTWTITFNCTPYGPYNVATDSDGVFDHADTDGSELAAAMTSTATTATVETTTDGPLWTTASPTLITNYDFESNLTGWTGSGATIARLTTPGIAPFRGVWSMQITPDGTSEFPNAGSDLIAVTVGQSYTLSGWVLCETAHEMDLNINWFDADINYLSTSSNGDTLVANEWTWFSKTATAPANAAFANAAPTIPNTPATTDVGWADMVTFRKTYDGFEEDFPFDIRVGGEVMTATAITSSAQDSFSTAHTDSWGDAEIGGTWTNSGGVAGNFDVTGGYGSHTHTTKDVRRISLLTSPGANTDIYTDITTSAIPTGGSLYGVIASRYTDVNNQYFARLEFTTSSTVVLGIRKRVSSTETELDTHTVDVTHAAGTFLRVRFQVTGSTVRAKAWKLTDSEPYDWQVSVTDTALTSAGSLGLWSIANSSNTNTNPEVRFDNFEVVNPQTFTVTRSVNGVTKAQTSGTDVRLAFPALTAL